MSTALCRRVASKRFIVSGAKATSSARELSLTRHVLMFHGGDASSHRNRNGIRARTRARSFANDNKSFQNILNKLKDDNNSNDNNSSNKDSSAKDEASTSSETGAPEERKETGSYTDTTTNDKNNAANTSSSSSSSPPLKMDPKELIERATLLARNSYSSVLQTVKLAWQEMTQSDTADGVLSKKVHQAASFKRATPKEEEGEEEGEDKGEAKSGGGALVFVKEPSSAWEQMKNRLQESPFIREMMKRSRTVGKVAADTPIGQSATKVAQGLKDKLDDAREFWETSQNPLVYSVSGMWENMTGETEEGIAIAAIKKLDPAFDKEEWSGAVRRDFAPKVIRAHLEGDLRFLKQWLGEACYNKLAADVRTRKSDGIVFDSNVLAIDENQTILRYIESGGVTGPIILAIYMVQQINCIKKKGEIIEGGEGSTCARFYSLAFQQEYVEDEGVVKWKVVDYEFTEKIPYY